MRRNGSLPLVAIVVITLVVFVTTLALGNRPNLGLDLQGGISVVLQPVVDGHKQKAVPAENLDQTKQIIEKRVNAIGVGEPDITVQGSTIVVQLPGIKDQKQALSLVGKTAKLRFRPVLDDKLGNAPPADAQQQIAALRKKLKIPAGKTGIQIFNEELAARGLPPIADPSAPATTRPTASIKVAVPTTTPGSGTGGSKSAKVARLRQQTSTTVAPSTSAGGATTTVVPTSTTTTTMDPKPRNKEGIQVYKNSKGALNDDFAKLGQLETAVANAKSATTDSAHDDPNKEVVLAGNGSLYKLGPAQLEGDSIADATAGLGQNGQWEVRPAFKDGQNGIDGFNAIASKCFNGDSTCPTKRLAIVLDGNVISAPTINSASFSKDQIQISGSFDESSAKELATSLRFGSLPLTLEPQQVQTVSATLGSGALHAGLIAGAVGLALVAAYLLFYYRLLGLVTLGSLSVSAALLWTIISFLGAHVGLTLTLAGIVGIIVSIGVSLDSSVVYFENLKEDVRNGKTLRTAVDRSYTVAFATVVKADVSSLIGAGVLYFLSIGPVRGFALYLGISTMLDLLTSYFFTRPAVSMLGKSSIGLKPSRFGIPLDDAPATSGAVDGAAVLVGADADPEGLA